MSHCNTLHHMCCRSCMPHRIYVTWRSVDRVILQHTYNTLQHTQHTATYSTHCNTLQQICCGLCMWHGVLTIDDIIWYKYDIHATTHIYKTKWCKLRMSTGINTTRVYATTHIYNTTWCELCMSNGICTMRVCSIRQTWFKPRYGVYMWCSYWCSYHATYTL